MWLSLYTAALHLCVPHLPIPVCATPAHTCSAPAGHLALWLSVVCSSSPPVQPPPPGPGLPSANTLGFSQSSATFGRPQLQAKPFLHLLTQRRISYLPFQKEEWRPPPLLLLYTACKAKRESATDFVSEVKAWVGRLRMDWGTTEVLTRRPSGCCSRIRRLVTDEVFNIKVCRLCVVHVYWCHVRTGKPRVVSCCCGIEVPMRSGDVAQRVGTVPVHMLWLPYLDSQHLCIRELPHLLAPGCTLQWPFTCALFGTRGTKGPVFTYAWG